MVEAVDILSELKAIKEDLSYLKEHMVDVDSVLTEDDYFALQAYREEKKAGELVSDDDVRKELDV